MQTTLETITPESASHYLLSNGGNRKLREDRIKQIVDIIKTGEWQTTHQGIAFSENGSLLDGQHRLHAIVKSNIPVLVQVTRGVSNDAFKTIDCGLKRSSSDLTKLPQHVAEACRLASAFAYRDYRPSADFLINIYETGFGKIHDEIAGSTSKRVRGFSSASVRTAATILVMDGHDINYIKEVYKNLVLQNYEKLPSVACQFSKQVNTGYYGNEKTSIFARALKVFNVKNANSIRLTLNASDTSNALIYCRETLQKHLKEKAR